MDWLKYAKLAKKAYEDSIEIDGFQSHFISDGSTQLHVLKNGSENLVIFRGTELNFEDILTDLDMRKQDGKHEGFTKAYLSICHQLYNIIEKNVPVTFIGHSLGGALAIIAGSFHVGSQKQVITFGAPRVFSKKAAKFYSACETTHRFENKCDPVPYLPPYSFNFRHVGMTLYLAKHSVIKDPWAFGPFMAMTLASKKEKISGHSIDSYIEKLQSFQYT